MARPVTLFTGQWADLKLEELCKKARDFGYDGLELACWGDHFEVDKALESDSYVRAKRDLLEKFELEGQLIDGTLRIEKEEGHRFVPQLIDAFPERITSVSIGKPTLEDVFVQLTGHRFWTEEEDA